jgi:pimeloyl-ACP methyl ester carboxylesterase
VGQPSPEAAAALLAPPPTERQAYIDASPSWMVWQSRKYRDEDLTRRQAAADYDRSFYPEGAPRQLAAIYASGARTEGLAALDVPALVIHGMDDTLITPSGGFRTAELIPGSVLLYVADMGHDMPEPLWPFLVDVIAAHVRRAEG